MKKKRYKNPENALETAKRLSERHKKAYEVWPHGEIKEVWPESKEVMCIRYESGTWFHYDAAGNWW